MEVQVLFWAFFIADNVIALKPRADLALVLVLVLVLSPRRVLGRNY